MQASESRPEYEIRRAGWQSSEFKAKIAADVLASIPVVIAIVDACQAQLPPTSMWFGVAGIVGIVANQINYANNRTAIKTSRNAASAAVEAARVGAATLAATGAGAQSLTDAVTSSVADASDEVTGAIEQSTDQIAGAVAGVTGGDALSNPANIDLAEVLKQAVVAGGQMLLAQQQREAKNAYLSIVPKEGGASDE